MKGVALLHCTYITYCNQLGAVETAKNPQHCLKEMRKYRLVAKKGEGTFSEVLKAQNVKDGKYHAIKCMKNRFESIDQVGIPWRLLPFIPHQQYFRFVEFIV